MRTLARLDAVTLLLFGLAALTACNPLHRSQAASDAPPMVIFENQSLEQAALYAVSQGGLELRIGTVPPGRTDTLTLRNTSLGSGTVTLVARLLAASRTPSTGPLSIRPGEWIRVTLPPDARILNVLPASPE